MNKQDEVVFTLIAELDVGYTVSYLGEAATGDWIHDKWSVRLGGVMLPFNTGTGHRLSLHEGRKEAKAIRAACAPTNNKYLFETKEYHKYTVAPTAASVLYCLLSDRRLGLESHRDFCGMLGYDEDSISARRSYLDCQEVGHKLGEVFTSAQIVILEEILEDY